MCCSRREEEEQFDEGETEIDEEESDGNIANDDDGVNAKNDANLVPTSMHLEDINMMKVKHSKEQLTARYIAVYRNKTALIER